MEQTQNSFPGIFKLAGQSLGFYRKNFKTLIFIGLIPFIISIAQQLLLGASGESVEIPIGFAFLGGIFVVVLVVLNIVAQIVQAIAFVKATKELDENRQVSVNEIYKSSFKIFFPFIWVSILYSLIVTGVSIFFIIPGVIAFVYIYFYYFTQILEGKKGLDALIESYHLVKGRWWDVFGRILGTTLVLIVGFMFVITVGSLIAIIIGGAFMGGLSYAVEALAASKDVLSPVQIFFVVLSGFLTGCVFYPIIYYAYYQIYKHLKSIKTEPMPAEEYIKAKKWFVGLSIWGVVAAVIISVVAISVSFFTT